MNKQQHIRALLGAIAALGLSSPTAFAAAYTLTPGSGAQDWNSAATWGGTGTPGSAVGDTVSLNVDYAGNAQVVNLSSNLTNPIASLTLGDTNAVPSASTVTASSGVVLSFASGSFIRSDGTAGAVNTINAPISLAGGIVFGQSASPTAGVSNDLIINGKITPTAAANRNIENSSVKTVTLGDIDISTGNTTATLTIRSGTTNVFSVGSNIILNGTIANGSSVAAGLALGARSGNATFGNSTIGFTAGTNFSSIQINANNTYTGNTTLGVQSNINTVFKINSDQPFGPAASGILTIGSSSAQNTIEALGGDRTITKNSILVNRSIAFQGSNSVVLAAPTKIDLSNGPSPGTSFITNNITAPGKTVTIGSAGANMNLNAANVLDLYRMRDVTGAGTTIIPSNIVDNSGASVPADSRMVIQQSGNGTLILTGNNTYQGSTRITGTGTIQLGNGGTTGSLAPSHDADATRPGVDSIAIVNGTGAGTLAFNRSDAFGTTLTANGAIGLAQKGAGTVTLSNAQFNSGANTIGDGVNPSTLIVNGGRVSSVGTTGANVSTVGNGQLAVTTVTLTGADTTASLNLKVGQPVYATGSPSAVAYVDSILTATTFRVNGLQVSATVGALGAVSVQSLTFGEGSALGTASAVTTVNNLGTLAGSGVIAGQVNALAGSILSPGAGDGTVATLSTGALNLTGATLDFDLAATTGAQSDFINASGAVTFSGLTFRFDAVTAGVLDGVSSYNLVSGTSFVGDVGLIATTFGSGLQGLYTPTYSVVGNNLTVAFSAIPEPSGVAALAGVAALGGCLVRRRRRA